MELITREEQLKQLNSILRATTRGRLQIVFITGEAGIGKTALVTTFIEQAKQQLSDLLVGSSKCHSIAGGQQEAYLPFVEILQAVSSETEGNPVWNKLARGLAELAPDWIQVLPGGDLIAAVIRTAQWGHHELSSSDSGVDTQRHMVQYTNALRLVAKTAPVLLWIDDLHWADNATLDMVSFMAEHLTDSRIMFISAYRPTDIATNLQGQPHSVKRLVDKLHRNQQCSELALPTFTQANVAEFLKVSNHKFPKAFVERIWRQSGGNPLFIKEYISLLHARRLLKRQQGVYQLVQPEVEIEIPANIQRVIEQRLSLIQQEMYQLLGYASVQGEQFTSGVLAHLLETQELSVLERLNLLERVHHLIQELEKRHLVVKVGTEYQFVHVLIQQVLYNDLSFGQRRSLHLAIARWLEALYGNQAGQYAADLAIHFERGGALQQAVHYHLQASHNALSVLTPDDTLVHAKMVQQLVNQFDEANEAAQIYLETLICIAEAEYLKTDYEAILVTVEEGERLCKNSEDFSEQNAHLLYWHHVALFDLGHREDSVKPLKQAIEILGDEANNPSLQCLLRNRLGRLYGPLPIEEIEQALDYSIKIAKRYNLPNPAAGALIQKGWNAMNWLNRPEDALRLGQEALTIGQNQNRLMEQIHSHRLVAYAYRCLNKGEQGLWHNEQAVVLAKRSGIPYALHLALASLAIAWRQVRENLKESLKIVHESIAITKQYHFSPFSYIFEEWFASTFGLGQWAEVEQSLEAFCDVYPDIYTRGWFYYRLLAYLAYARGQFKEAIDACENSLAILAEHAPDERDARKVQPIFGLTLLEVGDLQRSVEQFEIGQTYWQDRDPFLYTQCLRGLAKVDLLQNNPTQAITRLREALTKVEGYYSEDAWPVWLQVCLDLGRALLASAEVDEALQHALVGYERLKKMEHFLLGEAAFVVGQILVAQGKRTEAKTYLHEARDDWQRLELGHYMSTLDAFMEHSIS